MSLEEKTLSFMDDLNSGDSTKIRSYFWEDAQVKHVDEDMMMVLSLDQFMEVAPSFKSREFQEKHYKIDVKEFKNGLSYTDIYFHFYINGEKAFSGVDHVIWVQKGEDVKIESILSSELKPTLSFSPQSDEDIKMLNNLMNKWHRDVAEFRMEECRGSGVLCLIKGEWKIVHYNLTVLIENEKIKKFIKLRQK
jgi:hypothetical protein